MKTKYIDSFEAGMDLKSEAFFLRTIREMNINGEIFYKVRLEDKSGSIEASIPYSNFLKEYFDYENLPVLVDGIVSWAFNTLDVKIKIMKLPEGDIDLSELLVGLSKSKIDEYVSGLKKLISYVKEDTAYGKLLRAVFSEKRVLRMAELPATLMKVGHYNGGLLAETVTVAKMAIKMATAYIEIGNGLYTYNVNGDLLITAALLHNIGKIYEYSDYPNKRTEQVLLTGSAVTLSTELMSIIHECDVEISNSDFQELLHCALSIDPSHAKVKSVCKEAEIVKMAYATFSVCDEIDSLVNLLKKEELSGIVYCKKGNRYLKIGGDALDVI